jgi:hypothetical protein
MTALIMQLTTLMTKLRIALVVAAMLASAAFTTHA